VAPTRFFGRMGLRPDERSNYTSITPPNPVSPANAGRASLLRSNTIGPVWLRSSFGDMTSEALLLQIRQAFANVPRSRRTMADAEVEDDRSEASRFEEHDAHWWEVPDDLLWRCSAPFAFLEPQSFLYYLPAYMSWFVKTQGSPNSFSSESLLYYLADAHRGGQLARLLDSPQRSTVKEFLEYAQACPNCWTLREYADYALANIWKTEQIA